MTLTDPRFIPPIRIMAAIGLLAFGVLGIVVTAAPRLVEQAVRDFATDRIRAEMDERIPQSVRDGWAAMGEAKRVAFRRR